MPNAPAQAPEAAPKKPTFSESVDSLIERKKSERAAEGASAVQQSAEGVQHEVAEVMAGVEKPSDKIREKGEKKSDTDLKGGGAAASDDKSAAITGDDWSSAVLPREEVMVRKVRTAIQLQIKVEWNKAKRLRGQLTSGGAHEFGRSIARIRNLKKLLAGLFTATVEYVKELYMKYFKPSGERRSIEEIEMKN